MCDCSGPREKSIQQRLLDDEALARALPLRVEADQPAPPVAVVAPDPDREEAIRFMTLNKYAEGNYVLEDPARCTTGNCHGLTFGAGGETFIRISSIEGLLEELRWAGGWVDGQSADVLVCMTGSRVDHTARKAGARWRQTLPDGPIFTTTQAVLAAKYPECFDLSLRADRQRLYDKLAAQQAAHQTARQRLIALCGQQQLLAHPEMGYYCPQWAQEAQDDESSTDTLLDRIRQLEEFL